MSLGIMKIIRKVGTEQPIERKMGLFTNPDGSYPGENMPNPIQNISNPIQQVQQQSQQIAPLVFSNPERASRIESSLQNASFGGADIRSILEQLMKLKLVEQYKNTVNIILFMV